MATHDEGDQVSDIEKQLPNSPHDQPSPTAITDPTTQNPITNVENNNGNKTDNELSKSVANKSNTTATTTAPDSLSMGETIFRLFISTIHIWIIIAIFISIIIAILISPFALAYMIGSICITGDVQDPKTCFSRKKHHDLNKPSQEPTQPKGIYMKMLHFESTKEKFQRLNLVTITRAGCLTLLWLVVNLCVPSLKTVTLFQYPLWKWTLLVVVILLGYPMTMLAAIILFVVISIFNDEFTKQHNLDYVLSELGYSLISLLHFVAILVMWLCYFPTDHGLRPSKRVDKFGTCTFVSLLVGAILWVLKSATLLKWKANAVHKRFKGRILTTGFQLYFLTLINIDGVCLDDLLPWRDEYNSIMDQKSTSTQASTNIISDGVAKDRTNLRIQDFMQSKPVSVFQIGEVAKRVTDLTKVTQRENDGIPEIVAKCQEKIPTQGDTIQYITEETLREKFNLNKEDAQLLLQELKEEQMSDKITYDSFQKWMVDAHKNCLSVGYTLIDAFAVVSVLNRVMIGFIFVVVILVWLLITGLASTKVLVLIASPILTFTFVFGDTCKTFFQGIIFSFVTHPYDVGDRCIIEGIELEVKRIAILTTTFLRIGIKEKMIYPNASLATKVITNLEGEPDPSDTIELILDSSTTKLKILGLKKDLERFFESTDRDGYYEKHVHVAVKEIGSSIKVSIAFTHVMNVQDVSHSQCLQKKNKQRSELLIDIKQFLENQDIKLANLCEPILKCLL